MSWREQDHPRNRQGEFTDAWAHTVSGRLGGSIFDTFVDPNFDEPTDSMVQRAEHWAHSAFDYTDKSTGYQSYIFDVEHHGNGIVATGTINDGEHSIGGFQIAVAEDEDGLRVLSVEEIYIDPDHRGRGIAKRWVQRMENVARAERVQLITMVDQSGGFWESQGYTKGKMDIAEKRL